MNKLALFFVCSIAVCMPLAFGHADPMRMKLIDENGFEPQLTTIGLNSTNADDEDEKEEPEFMTYKWQQKYYIPILTTSIASSIAIVAVIVYRSDE